MELSEIKGFKNPKTYIDLVELLFKHDGLLITRPGYSTGVDDWEERNETEIERQDREDEEVYQRTIPEEYRDEPAVKTPFLEFHKYRAGHNWPLRGSFPIRTENIVGIRRLGSVLLPERISKYTPSGLVEVRYENPDPDIRSEIRAGYLKNIDQIVGAWEQDAKPKHIDLYTHLQDGKMQSPIRMKSARIDVLNRLYISESLNFS